MVACASRLAYPLHRIGALGMDGIRTWMQGNLESTLSTSPSAQSYDLPTRNSHDCRPQHYNPRFRRRLGATFPGDVNPPDHFRERIQHVL